jgi:hypothetical protein
MQDNGILTTDHGLTPTPESERSQDPDSVT